jgi:hypothetical protein
MMSQVKSSQVKSSQVILTNESSSIVPPCTFLTVISTLWLSSFASTAHNPSLSCHIVSWLWFTVKHFFTFLITADSTCIQILIIPDLLRIAMSFRVSRRSKEQCNAMQCRTSRCCTALHYILYFSILYLTTLFCPLHCNCIALLCIVLYYTALRFTLLHWIVLSRTGLQCPWHNINILYNSVSF